MSRMHDEDLYGGYDDGSQQGGVFQPVGADAMPPGTAMQPPGTAMRQYVTPGTAAQRMGTAQGGGGDPARPMTSIRGAGFISHPAKKFDPLAQARAGAAAAKGGQMQTKSDSSAEEIAKELEKTIHDLLEQSARAVKDGDPAIGLDKATTARSKERHLCKYRDQHQLGDNNLELSFAVQLNLAIMYHANKDYKEALELYTVIVRNKEYQNGGRLRINMGNIYFEQKKYSNAIKMYRMALDQIPATSREVRFKIMRNIGLAFVRMGQYQDALQSFAQVMENVPDHQTGYNLVVCAFALGDREGMKDAFNRLLTVKTYESPEEEEMEMTGLGDEDDDINQVVQDDGLKEELRRRQNTITRCIVSAAQLISEKIDRQGGAQAGYTWCAEQLRAAGYVRLANEVELAKASMFLANKEFVAAITVFKEFEKKEPRIKARAATNLAFLYSLEGETEAANKYADLALKNDRLNAQAYVNKGIVLFQKGDLDGARTMFSEACATEYTCVEALYNLGLVNLRMGDIRSALTAFKKLHSMLPDNYDVLWQLAQCYDLQGDYKQSVKWLETLSSMVPNDPGVLSRLGAIHAREDVDDEQRALHYYQESYRVFPVNMDVISWLGAYHVKNEVYEKAMPFFDLASKIQPQEVKWALMVASCYRRIGAFPQALAKYKEINISHPSNVECLRYLVHLCTELKRKDDAQKYMGELRKAEHAQQAEAQATTLAESQARRAEGEAEMGAGGGRANAGYEEVALNPGMNIPMAKGKKVMAKEEGNDDWGNEELGDDLLPM